MATLDPDRLLALLRDPNVESQEIAVQACVPREEAGRATRLLLALARAKPEDVLSLPGPLAGALARAALVAARVDLLAALTGHAARDVAKEAKRCLHVLRARGVEIPEPPRAPAPAPAPATEPPIPAYASAMDDRGERVAWLPRGLPGKGIEVGQAVLSDERGLLELQVGLLGRKEWRAFVRDLLERGAGMGVAEVARERVHSWIVTARALNEQTGQRVPDGADLWLGPLGPAAPTPDPAARFPRLPDEEERAALEGSAQLHDLPLLRGWLASEEYLRTVAARLDEVQVSPLYIDERQRAAQAERVMADAVDTYLDEPRRTRLAARLHAMAEHLANRGDAAHAAAAAAAARALAAGVPGRDIPFARPLVEKAFPRERPAQPAPGGAASPLIVGPRAL